MILYATLTSADHLNALAAARATSIPAEIGPGQMYKSLDDINNWFARIWDKVELVAMRAHEGTIEEARRIGQEAVLLWESAKSELGRRMNELMDRLAVAFDHYMHDTVSAALRRVQTTIVVGGLDHAVTSVAVSQSIKLSISVQSAIDKLIAFVADGTVTVNATYSRLPLPG